MLRIPATRAPSVLGARGWVSAPRTALPRVSSAPWFVHLGSVPPRPVVRRTTMPWSSPQGPARPGRSHSCLAAGPHSRPSAYYDALVRSSLGPLPQAHSAFSSAGVNSTRKLQELACRVLRGVAARRKTTTVEVWGDSHMRNLFSDWLGLDRYASSGEAEIARQRSDCAVPSLSPL